MEFQLKKHLCGTPETFYAYGTFTSWDEFDIAHAPTEDMFSAISEALEARDQDLAIGGKSCEEMHYRQLFKTPLDAADFESQCLSVAPGALSEGDRKFLLAGQAGEVIPGYWNWLSCQVELERALLPEGRRRGFLPQILFKEK
jgi:hypothetical protein